MRSLRHALERCRPCLESFVAKQHFETNADAPTRLARLLRNVLRPRDARPHLEHQPVAKDELPICHPDAVLSQRHRGIELTFGERLYSYRAAIADRTICGKRRVPMHALCFFRD